MVRESGVMEGHMVLKNNPAKKLATCKQHTICGPLLCISIVKERKRARARDVPRFSRHNLFLNQMFYDAMLTEFCILPVHRFQHGCIVAVGDIGKTDAHR